jgi:hypothetical protein
LALVEYPMLLEESISHSGKAQRSKLVLIAAGNVVWRSVGLNLP